MNSVRRCNEQEQTAICEIINAAADKYRGVIPADRWHEPYMTQTELAAEIAASVQFWGWESAGSLVGVMGVQQVMDVELIRHAYVLPRYQGAGIGGRLLGHLCGLNSRPRLVGTWAAATWAIDFYQRHGFVPVEPARAPTLLRKYWNVPERQIETSVVLARP